MAGTAIAVGLLLAVVALVVVAAVLRLTGVGSTATRDAGAWRDESAALVGTFAAELAALEGSNNLAPPGRGPNRSARGRPTAWTRPRARSRNATPEGDAASARPIPLFMTPPSPVVPMRASRAPEAP